jgi:hypothetical protein
VKVLDFSLAKAGVEDNGTWLTPLFGSLDTTLI